MAGMPKRRKKRQSRVNPGLRDYATAGLRGIAERGKRAADAVERAAALRKLASDHGYDLVKR